MERGVSLKEGVFFPKVSEFAGRYLFTIHYGALYSCRPPYTIDRQKFDYAILFLFHEGELNFDYRGKMWRAGADEIVILSGKYPNHYWAEVPVTFSFFHFSGNVTEEYIEQLYQVKGAHFTGEPALQAKDHALELMKMLKDEKVDGNLMSLHIHSIFTHLLGEFGDHGGNEVMVQAERYIDTHFSEQIKVADLAALFNYSQYHFSRLFKVEVGIAPHQYLLNRRILEAKRMLANTRGTVEAIAFDCGFNSISHFIRAFKSATDLTPNEFRKIPF